MMRSWLLLTLFIPNLAFAQERDRVRCDFEGGYFRVLSEGTKYEKYVGSAKPIEVLLDCGEKSAAGIIGPYFVVFQRGKFSDKYMGSSNPSGRAVSAGVEIAGAVAIHTQARGSETRYSLVTGDFK